MHVFYAGSGGAGKSVCLAPVAERLDLTIKTSVVREYYAKNNIDSQIDMAKMPEDAHSSFQFDLACFYIEEVTKFCAEHENTLMDRSIFCHFGYFITASPSANWETIKKFDKLFEDFMKLKPIIFYFPYPPPWVLEAKTYDGFRHVVPTQDLLVDAVIYKTSRDYMHPSDWITVPMYYDIPSRCQFIANAI
jgi:hypothetical protein